MIKEFGAIIGDLLWVTRLFTPAFVATVRFGDRMDRLVGDRSRLARRPVLGRSP
ncbi:hypothetical protein [Hamadaea tsunoensis]|uniref:hypothetical protein n=1 Tax=Hamadaea tsunoensis TaxID=53368 RepID=UPI0012FAD378|nr:hypothetical protein [Hamadaea tsunoensis]